MQSRRILSQAAPTGSVGHASLPSVAAVSALILAVSTALAPSVVAQPLLLLDTAFIHGAAADTRPNAMFPLSGAPANWAAPVDYAGGTAHFRLEILDKPTGTAIRYQPCLERGATRACATAQILADSGMTRAVYTWSQALSQWTPAMAFSDKPDRLIFILQDAYGRPIVPAGSGTPNPAWAGQPFLQLYYPMKVRVSAAVAAAGAAFPGWDGMIPTGILRSRPPGGPRAGSAPEGSDRPGAAARGPAFRLAGRLGYLHVTLDGERSIRDAAGRGLAPRPGTRSP